MPPRKIKSKTAKKRPDSNDEDKNSQNRSVANVNKNGGKDSKAKKRKYKTTRRVVKKRSCATAANITASDVEAQESETEQEEINDSMEHEASFIEEDQIVRMAVRNTAEDDEFLPSESDDEVELGISQPSAADTESEDQEEGLINSDNETMENDEDHEIDRDPELPSTEQRIRNLDQEMLNRIQELHQLATQGGLTQSANLLGKIANGKEMQMSGKNINSNASRRFHGDREVQGQGRIIPSGQHSKGLRSEATIYDAAVAEKRNSSSSEEEFIGNISDGSPTEKQPVKQIEHVLDKLLSDQRRRVIDRAHERRQDDTRLYDEGPSTSDGRGRVREITPEEKTRRMIQEAENAKARIFTTPGKNNYSQSEINEGEFCERPTPVQSASAIIDENYIIVGAHVDELTIAKIERGEYVDFGKLIPRDRVIAEDDGRMEMQVREGRTYWVPVSTATNISNFTKWEQAFRVFSNIYCKANAHRAAELIEYNHVIHTIAMTYTWENVYTYDKEFRLHMSRYPHRSWAIILQQAWSLRLRDRISANNHNNNNYASNNYQARSGGNRAKISEPCRRFNRGKCNFGPSCKYEHRCSYNSCAKFGHAFVNCRKAIADKQTYQDRDNKRDNYVRPDSTKPAGAGVVRQETAKQN